MTRVKAAAALLGSLAASLAWPGGLAERGLRPDFLLLFSLGAGLLGGARAGFAGGVLAGILAAPLTLEPFGLDAALLGACGLLSGELRHFFSAVHPGVQGTLAGLLFLGTSLLRLLLLEVSGAPVASLGLLPAVLAGTAATAAAAPVVLLLLDALSVFRTPERGRPVLV